MSFHAGSSIWKGLKMRESMAVSTGTVKNPPALQGGFLITAQVSDTGNCMKGSPIY